MDCCICFDENETKIFCSSSKCESNVCGLCMEEYLNLCKKDNLLPICVNIKCKIPYLHRDFPIDMREKYIDICSKILLERNESKYVSQYNYNIQIDNIRNSRCVYLEKKFPPSIVYVAKKYYSKKLNSVSKKIKEGIEKHSEELKRKCMILTCKGYLNENFECSLCRTIFCSKCENKKNENHSCKEEDIESMNFINSINRCPHCYTPVEKSSGCNSMTCTKCHKSFTYDHNSNIGKSSEFGNDHNQNFNEKTNFVQIYEKEIQELNILDDINNFIKNEPKSLKDTRFMRIIGELRNDEDNDKLKLNLIKEMQRIEINMLKIREFNNLMIRIEQELVKKTITKDALNAYILQYTRCFRN